MFKYPTAIGTYNGTLVRYHVKDINEFIQARSETIINVFDHSGESFVEPKSTISLMKGSIEWLGIEI